MIAWYSRALPTQLIEGLKNLPPTRRARTCVNAAMIGAGTALIAPVYFAVIRSLAFDTPIAASLLPLLAAFYPPAVYCVLLAIGFSWFVPPGVRRILSRRQHLIPPFVNTLLFSLYFAWRGHGLLIDLTER